MRTRTSLLKHLGAASGAIGLSIITTLYHAVFFASVLNDGQYGMVWMFTLPAGLVLGWAAKESIKQGMSPFERMKSCLMGCFLVVIPVILYLWQTTSNNQWVSSQPVSSALTEAILFALPTIVCVLALTVWGIILSRSKASK